LLGLLLAWRVGGAWGIAGGFVEVLDFEDSDLGLRDWSWDGDPVKVGYDVSTRAEAALRFRLRL